MDNVFGMGRRQRIGNLQGSSQQGLQVEGMLADEIFERRPIEILHDQEGLPAFLPKVKNGADVRVIARRRRLCFPLKTLPRLRILGKSAGEKFQGYFAVEPSVLRLVNDAHSA